MSNLNLDFLNPLREWILGVSRIAIGLMLLQHGTVKHLNFPEHPANALGFTQLPGIAGIFELVFGALLVFGLFGRFSAFVLSGVAASAYWIVHAPKGVFPFLNGGETAATFAFALLLLAAFGPGKLALDNLISKGKMQGA